LSVPSIVTTCIGIPLFGSEVSPRFCFADRILVVEVERGRELRRFVISLRDPWLPGRVSELATLGVRALLCGGFNRTYLPTAEGLGIQVITGVSGDAEAALAAFLRGPISPRTTRMRRCRRSEPPAK
jgi:predicted Fe-Mo cluster-binding NifX family protein